MPAPPTVAWTNLVLVMCCLKYELNKKKTRTNCIKKILALKEEKSTAEKQTNGTETKKQRETRHTEKLKQRDTQRGNVPQIDFVNQGFAPVTTFSL